MSGINQVGDRLVTPSAQSGAESGAVTPAESSAQPVQSTGPAAAIAQKLAVSEAELAQAREALLRKDLLRLLSPAVGAVSDTEQLLRRLGELQVLTEESLGETGLIEANITARPEIAAAKEKFSELKQAVDRISRKSGFDAHYGALRDLAAELEKTLAVIEEAGSAFPGFVTRPRAGGAELAALEKALSAGAPEKRSEAARPSSGGGAVARLLSLLESIGSRGSEIVHEGERLLKALYRGQVELLKSLESSIKRLLVTAPGQNSAQTLLQTLERVEVEPAADDTPQQLKFKAFVADFKSELSAFLKNAATEIELRNFAALKLQIIRNEFGLADLGSRAAAPADYAPELLLNKEQLNLLKAIEAQIKIIIDAPPGFMSLHDGSVSPGGFDWRQFLENLQKVTSDEKLMRGLEEPLRRALLDIFDVTSSPPRAAGAPPDEQEMRAALKRLLPLLGDLIRKADAPVKTESPGFSLSEPQLAALRSIERLSREIIETAHVDQGVKNILPGAEAAASIKNHPAFKALKEMLLSFESMIPNPSKPQEQLVTEFATHMLQQIERDVNRSLPALHETLRRGLEILHDKFIFNGLKSEDKAYAALESQGLRALENMIAGQEVLQRMAPVMKAFGEPVLTIFPFILQGLLSKFEVTAFPRPPQVEQEGGGGKRPPAEGYERVHVVVPFPDIGEVTVDIAHRKREVILSFGFERSDVAEFVKKELPKLELVLKNSDYEEVAFMVGAGTRPDGSVQQQNANPAHLVVA